MSRVVVIGGTGKVGTYLVPMLVDAGLDVVNVSRGDSRPSLHPGSWNSVRQVQLDRQDPQFPRRIAALEPDIVVDMICFRDSDLRALTAALVGRLSHYLVAGSVWVHGPGTVVPSTEAQDLDPFGEYGTEKLKMTRTLTEGPEATQVPGTVIHPGHIVSPGHPPINPQGNLNLNVFSALMRGAPVVLPNFGMETLHHVHAEDVAGTFMAAIRAGQPSHAQAFHAVSPGAVTLRGYAREVASWFGRDADLTFKSFGAFRQDVTDEEAETTYNHILRSANHSMEKAGRLLGFTPRHSSFAAVREALNWMLERGIIPAV